MRTLPTLQTQSLPTLQVHAAYSSGDGRLCVSHNILTETKSSRSATFPGNLQIGLPRMGHTPNCQISRSLSSLRWKSGYPAHIHITSGPHDPERLSLVPSQILRLKSRHSPEAKRAKGPRGTLGLSCYFQPESIEARVFPLDTSGDTGLVSAGRTNKGTPPLTTPGHTSKSSAMDVSPHIF